MLCTVFSVSTLCKSIQPGRLRPIPFIFLFSSFIAAALIRSFVSFHEDTASGNDFSDIKITSSDKYFIEKLQRILCRRIPTNDQIIRPCIENVYFAEFDFLPVKDIDSYVLTAVKTHCIGRNAKTRGRTENDICIYLTERRHFRSQRFAKQDRCLQRKGFQNKLFGRQYD